MHIPIPLIDTYQLELPSDLPPSHRGKTIRFAYNLVLGVQRGSVHTPAKSVQLPFRLYNNISELGTRPVYDMMSPVIWHKDTAISHLVGQGRQTEKPTINPSRCSFLMHSSLICFLPGVFLTTVHLVIM